MIRLLLTVLLAVPTACDVPSEPARAAETAAADSTEIPAWYRPPPTAEQWAPELHSADGWTYTPTFTPDLLTAYFVLWNAPDYSRPQTSIQELYVARWSDTGGAWSDPERVAATAGWRTDWPHVSHDGRRLFLSSNKPHSGHYRYPDGRPADDFDLWAADLDADGALEAATLAPLESPDLNRRKTPENARIGYVHNETAPRTDRAGRLFFWTERLDDGGGRRDIYLAEPDGAGAWREPMLLPFNTARRESGVAADPDGRWIIIASEGRGGLGRSDLFVVARDGDRWAEPVNLGPEVNTRHREDSPEISPDGRSLFFSTNRPGPGIPTVDAGAGPAATVHWVDLEAVPAFRRATSAR
ncbi:TolB family protein [Rubrivirga sp.]|uniref:TolB family protein n=1 Tax=Rubrivirga sp. TaxID=1885344 RepID=UPI003C7744C9